MNAQADREEATPVEERHEGSDKTLEIKVGNRADEEDIKGLRRY